jgi:hypothetical protein
MLQGQCYIPILLLLKWTLGVGIKQIMGLEGKQHDVILTFLLLLLLIFLWLLILWLLLWLILKGCGRYQRGYRPKHLRFGAFKRRATEWVHNEQIGLFRRGGSSVLNGCFSNKAWMISISGIPEEGTTTHA